MGKSERRTGSLRARLIAQARQQAVARADARTTILPAPGRWRAGTPNKKTETGGVHPAA